MKRDGKTGGALKAKHESWCAGSSVGSCGLQLHLAAGIGNEVLQDACVRCGVVPDRNDLAAEQAQDSCVQSRLGDNAMASNLRIFFAGVGTTFILFGMGFGGGLMMAKSALEEPIGDRSRASSELPPARVILPSTTEAALPLPTPKEQQIVAAAPEPAPQPQAQPANEVAKAPIELQVDKVDTRKAKAEERARRKRIAERKAKQLAAERAKRQHVEPDEGPRGPVMAFGGDEPRQSDGFGFFGRE